MFQYNQSLYDSRDIFKYALEMFQEIKKRNISYIISSSSSGCSLAASLLTIAAMENYTLLHLYIRKEGESSHALSGDSDIFTLISEDFEGVIKFAFVDDFVCKGATFERCINYINKFNENAREVTDIYYTPKYKLDISLVCLCRIIDFDETEEVLYILGFNQDLIMCEN